MRWALKALPYTRKIWEFKYIFAGIRRVTSFGTYPNVSLAGARGKAKKFRELIEKNINLMKSLMKSEIR